MRLALGFMREQTGDRLLKVFAVYGNRLNKQWRFGLWYFFLFVIDNDNWDEELWRSIYRSYVAVSTVVMSQYLPQLCRSIYRSYVAVSTAVMSQYLP